MSEKTPVSIHWFRRDLRLNDNHGLLRALRSGYPVIPLFIFDEEILTELSKDDARVTFIHQELSKLDSELRSLGTAFLIQKGKPIEIWKKLVKGYALKEVHTNRDYEPYALKRDADVKSFLAQQDVEFIDHKDQVIFEMNEVLKDDGTPYTVYTPYSKKWFSHFSADMLDAHDTQEVMEHFHRFSNSPVFPSLEDIGFEKSAIQVRPYQIDKERIEVYDKKRNFPAADGTSDLSPHLRFGTISVREAFKRTYKINHTFAKELIWREFFMQILYHFPKVVDKSFREKYDRVPWRNDEKEFKAWCEGRTGYAMVDSGMRELNETGYMHNRVRMVVASFLCKHLLIDWRWGEAYFAKKLLDYELSSNNGNWQWAAGTGCDAAPYFRVFNPMTQIEKFDQYYEYIKRWVPEFQSSDYVEPIVDHKEARKLAISTYKKAIS